MARSHRHPVPFAVGMALICLVALLGPASGVRAAGRPKSPVPGPTISIDDPMQETPGTIFISGVGFTPGGTVDVTVQVLDAWGRSWRLTAEATTTRPRSVVSHDTGDGRIAGDPAYNTPGGMFLVMFEHVCGAQVTVQAFDREPARWSNWVAFVPTCSAANGLPRWITPWGGLAKA